jgi:ECF sigma factor
MLSDIPDVTQILSAIEAGDRMAAAELLPLVYDELRKLGRCPDGRGETGADPASL